MRIKKNIYWISLLVLISIVLVGIIGYRNYKKELLSTQKDISFRMKWYVAGSMTGYFTAKEKGFFANQGLNVKILPGGPENNSIKLVAAGSDHFGITGADELLLARAKGIPIKAIAVIFKKSPVSFIAKREKGIRTPQDFFGKKIEVSYGENIELQYRALLKKFDIPQNQVKEVPYAFSLIPFLEDKVDVSVAYAMDQAVRIKSMGYEINEIFASDYGINPYGDVIFAREDYIRQNSETITRFLKAVIEGWQWTYQDPEEAVDYLVKAEPYLKKEEQILVVKATLPFIDPDKKGIEKMGVMEKPRWEATQKLLLDFGALKQSQDIDRVFDNQFIIQATRE